MKNIAVIHHSLTPKALPADQAERSFNNSHKTRKFPISSKGWYIGYHYVIYGNGELRQYREDHEIGAHTSEQQMNYKSIGICLSGNFDMELPNPEQIETLKQLMKRLKIKTAHPHRHFAPKSCYGRNLPDDWSQKLIMPEPTPQTHEPDITEFMSKDGRTVGLALKVPTQEVLSSVKTILQTYGLEIKPRVDSKDL